MLTAERGRRRATTPAPAAAERRVRWVDDAEMTRRRAALAAHDGGDAARRHFAAGKSGRLRREATSSPFDYQALFSAGDSSQRAAEGLISLFTGAVNIGIYFCRC